MNEPEQCLSIGQFASYGRVSVRMLRHYDAIGLLAPHAVDPVTGYRWYHPSQFTRLARIVRLRELGLGLEGIATVLDGAAGRDAVRSVLVDHARVLRARLDEDGRRLESVEEMLRTHEGDAMSSRTDDPVVTVTAVPPSRVYVLRDTAAGFGPDLIGPVVGPLFDRLHDQLVAAGLPPALPAISWYVAQDDEAGAVQVNASFTAPDDAAPGPVPGQDFTVVDLPALPEAAVLRHVGPPDTLGEAWMRLSGWMEAQGWAPAGPCREVYLSEDDVPPEEWITELHYPVARA